MASKCEVGLSPSGNRSHIENIPVLWIHLPAQCDILTGNKGGREKQSLRKHPDGFWADPGLGDLVLSRLWSWWSGWDQAATGPGSSLTKIRGWDRKTGERGGRPVVHCHCFVPKPTHQPSSQHSPAQKCLDFDPWHFVSDPPIPAYQSLLLKFMFLSQ